MYKRALIMGMPTTVNVVDPRATEADIDEVFNYLRSVDNKFSTYKEDSEMSKINRGELSVESYSTEMSTVLALCEQTRCDSNGYFDIHINGKIDPSGLVKGYAIFQASEILRLRKFTNLYVDIGGDVQVYGLNQNGVKWRVGIQNPFNPSEILKVLCLTDRGIATSGTYVRGNHIYDPVRHTPATYIASMTVVGPNVYEADRFVTAAFAMGEAGIQFIESMDGFDAYMITNEKMAYYTSGFGQYIHE